MAIRRQFFMPSARGMAGRGFQGTQDILDETTCAIRPMRPICPICPIRPFRIPPERRPAGWNLYQISMDSHAPGTLFL